MKLSDIVAKKIETVVEYPTIPTFKIKIAYLSRDELLKLRKRATTNKYNRKTHTMEETVDPEVFQKLYVNSVILGWEGLTIKDLSTLMPIDMDRVDNIDAEVEYTQENALELMKNSIEFDNFISDYVSELSNFTKSNSKSSKKK